MKRIVAVVVILAACGALYALVWPQRSTSSTKDRKSVV